MTSRQPQYRKEELARRGQEIYEQQVGAQVEAGNHGKFVAIDVDGGAYEVADDTRTAVHHLLARFPDAQIWMVRIGHPGVHRFGWRATEKRVWDGRQRLVEIEAIDAKPLLGTALLEGHEVRIPVKAGSLVTITA